MSRPTEQCQQREFNWVECEKRINYFPKKHMHVHPFKVNFYSSPFFTNKYTKKVYYKITYLNVHAT